MRRHRGDEVQQCHTQAVVRRRRAVRGVRRAPDGRGRALRGDDPRREEQQQRLYGRGGAGLRRGGPRGGAHVRGGLDARPFRRYSLAASDDFVEGSSTDEVIRGRFLRRKKRRFWFS
eukprot:COSAG06_NODE_562_length_14275_cov_28.599041_3_plen_117_part_00